MRALVAECRVPDLPPELPRALACLVGCFGYEKAMPEGVKMPCEVQVHALKVTEYAEEFKEKGKRRIEWFSPREAAERVQETWWPYFVAWYRKRSGKMVDAPKKAGNENHPPLGKAPGTYVYERAS